MCSLIQKQSPTICNGCFLILVDEWVFPSPGGCLMFLEGGFLGFSLFPYVLQSIAAEYTLHHAWFLEGWVRVVCFSQSLSEHTHCGEYCPVVGVYSLWWILSRCQTSYWPSSGTLLLLLCKVDKWCNWFSSFSVVFFFFSPAAAWMMCSG